MKQTNDSWRVDETYVKVRGKWVYLYRAVDSTGQTPDFLLKREALEVLCEGLWMEKKIGG